MEHQGIGLQRGFKLVFREGNRLIVVVGAHYFKVQAFAHEPTSSHSNAAHQMPLCVALCVATRVRGIVATSGYSARPRRLRKDLVDQEDVIGVVLNQKDLLHTLNQPPQGIIDIFLGSVFHPNGPSTRVSVPSLFKRTHEGNDLPALWLRQVSKRWHAVMKRSIFENPE